MKLLQLLLFLALLAGAKARYCYAQITNIPLTPMVCHPHWDPVNCTVACNSSVCTRGFDYNVFCPPATNATENCPVCEIKTSTSCPSDCDVICQPLNTSWTDCALPRGVKIRPPEYIQVCDEVPCSNAATVSIFSLFAALLL